MPKGKPKYHGEFKQMVVETMRKEKRGNRAILDDSANQLRRINIPVAPLSLKHKKGR